MKSARIQENYTEQEPVYELSHISIESNHNTYKKRKNEDSSTPLQSLSHEVPIFEKGQLNKKISMQSLEEMKFSKEKQKQHLNMPSKQKIKKKNKGMNNDKECQKKYQKLVEKVNNLQNNNIVLEQKFFSNIKVIKDEMYKKQDKNIELKSDLETIKKDLIDRKKDINLLISMIKQLTLCNQTQISDTISNTTKETIDKKNGNTERELKSIQKIKKTSNEKSKKNIGTTKKIPIEIKQKVASIKFGHKA